MDKSASLGKSEKANSPLLCPLNLV
uniref:Uncharacterized protein n=1 Tax=Anguilla anguilla TaxID=7936 RepID=A0A0E9RM04_ANGAN